MEILDMRVDADTVDDLFRLILRRPVGNEEYVAKLIRDRLTVRDLISGLLGSDEMKYLWRQQTSHRNTSIDAQDYIVPKHLSVAGFVPRKVIVIGSCAVDRLLYYSRIRYPDTEFHYIPFNNGMHLPDMTEELIRSYDFQIVQIPQRGFMQDGSYIGKRIDDLTSFERFDQARLLLRAHLCRALCYTEKTGIETFVMNLLPAQQNPLGRMEHRYNLNNIVYFVEQLNIIIADELNTRKNCFLLDVDQIASMLGKRYIQDDTVSHCVHGSMLVGVKLTPEDDIRLESPGDVDRIYGDMVGEYSHAVLDTVLAFHKTIRQIDSIKMVIFDLDDTLWRGVAAEKTDDIDALMVEGWPLGILEAAYYLAERGIMLALVSKNDAKVATAVWDKLYGTLMPLDRFVSVRMNWKDKSENILDILNYANIGVDSVLFVDDNPVERARVREALPGIRCLDCSLAEWRRTLLWSPEIQTPFISPEAIQRTNTIKNKESRDVDQRSMGSEEFLEALKMRIVPVIVNNEKHPRFGRCFELINKTNQYNTTGRRWSLAEMSSFLFDGGRIVGFDVNDKYSSYGITAVALIAGPTVVQFLMSCRIFGLGVELTAASIICRLVRSDGYSEIFGHTHATGRNMLSLSFFAQVGFVWQHNSCDDWCFDGQSVPAIPAHVSLDSSQLPTDLVSVMGLAHSD